MSSPEKPVFQFIFLRHGEFVGNAESRWQGQSDYPLTEKGKAQAHALAKRLKSEGVKFDLVISSPLIRAKETAEIIASALNVKVEFDPIWIERNIGEMEGLQLRKSIKTTSLLMSRPTIRWAATEKGIGSYTCVQGKPCMLCCVARPGSYLIVSHGGLLNQLMHAIVGVAPHVDPSGVRFHFENTAFAQCELLSIPTSLGN